jgi:hypothetical protein
LQVFAQSGVECRFWSKPYVRTFPLRGGYKLKLTHTDPPAQIGCRAEVLSPAGASTFAVEAWDISLDNKDVDIEGDGHANLVLRGYSGGAHCCWTYWILSPSKRPVLRKQIENQAHVYFQSAGRNGPILLVAQDGTFVYFDGLCYECSVLPVLFLKMEGDKLVDVSSNYLSHYDDQIKAARSQLIHRPLEKFIAARNSEQMESIGYDVKPLVLTIVLGYLYSGREALAWEALDEMWPSFDRNRIKSLILKMRAEGLLRYVDKPR